MKPRCQCGPRIWAPFQLELGVTHDRHKSLSDTGYRPVQLFQYGKHLAWVWALQTNRPAARAGAIDHGSSKKGEQQ